MRCTKTIHYPRDRAQDHANNWQLRRNPHLLKIKPLTVSRPNWRPKFLVNKVPMGCGSRTNPKPFTNKPRDVLALFAGESSHIYISEFLAALDNNADSAERLLTIVGKRDQWLDVLD